MGSPFPGMNPFLERDSVWHDFHERFIPAIADSLGEQIGPGLIARIDDHIFVHELPPEERRFVGRADVSVSELPPTIASDSTTAVLTAPAEVGLPEVDEERLSFVEIRDRDSWRVVTIIELLSPANKCAGTNRDQYLAKRGQVLNSRVHFIELDLLRGGPRMPLKNQPECDYYALVSRVERRPKADIWALKLREPLPTIPVPLNEDQPDAHLDLQSLLHRVYDAARYANYVYRGEPEPRIAEADAAWAKQFVPGADH